MSVELRLPALPYTKRRLDNGLDVIVRSQPHLPNVAVNLWYHVGSKNEERRQRGFAHLFEHLMFEGSEHFPGDYFKHLQKVGASINGSTSPDRTNYFVDLPSAHLELALAIESDRMGYFLPALTEEKIRIQKDVVKNEYRQNYANRPYGQVWRLLAEAMYPPTHPYNWLTIGFMEDVEAASKDDVEAFFRRFYVPSNASLALVGDLDEDEAFALAEKYFGSLPGGSRSIRPHAPPVQLAEEVFLPVHDRVELQRIYCSWHTVPQFSPDDAALTILADILTRGKSSRLYHKLVMEDQVAQDISSHQGGRELAGTFGVSATLRPGNEWTTLRDDLDREIAAIAREGVREEELARARNGRLSGFVAALDNIGGFGGVADRLNAYNVYLGDPGRITSDLVRYQAVTSEHVRAAADRYLHQQPRVTLHVSGGRPSTVLTPEARSTPPAPATPAVFRAPIPEVRTLSNGLPIWVVPRRDLPIVSATIVVRAGASDHSPEKGGLAGLTSGLLDEGTSKRSSIELANAIEGMGSSLSTNSGWDGSYVGMFSLTPYLEPTLDLAVEVLREASIPAKEFDRLKGQTLAALRSSRDSAEARAGRAFLGALYPEDHPYRVGSDGNEQTVAGLGRDDLISFYRNHYRPEAAAFIVAGDVDPDEVARLAERRLSDWKTTEQSQRAVTGIPVREKRLRILLLDRPGAAQAVVRVGHVGVPRPDPSHDDLLLLNQVLGGQFTSRLNENLRETRGMTYGVRSQFDFRRGPGPFLVSASLQSDRVAEALVEIRKEVAELLDHRPVTDAELNDARRSLLEGQARHFETPSALVSRYGGLFVLGLPLDEYARYPERLNSRTAESLLESARANLDPDALVAVVVGQANSLLGPLRDLGWCEIETFDERDQRLT